MSEESAEQAIIRALENQVSFAYSLNRDLTFELGARDQVITSLRAQIAKLEQDNQTLRMYYKDWCEAIRSGAYKPPPVKADSSV